MYSIGGKLGLTMYIVTYHHSRNKRCRGGSGIGRGLGVRTSSGRWKEQLVRRCVTRCTVQDVMVVYYIRLLADIRDSLSVDDNVPLNEDQPG
jgi:hypothetical protein